jgi:DNA-binding phage protein
MSYELKIDPKRRAAGRFIGTVRKALINAALEEKQSRGLSQQKVAECLGVNRSVINRMLRGEVNLTLRSVAELAWAMGWQPHFSLRRIEREALSNETPDPAPAYVAVTTSTSPRSVTQPKVYGASQAPSNHYRVAAE